MPENQRKNRHSRGSQGKHHAPASREEDIIALERDLQQDPSVLEDRLPNPAWVDDRSGRPGPPPSPGVKTRRPRRRG